MSVLFRLLATSYFGLAVIVLAEPIRDEQVSANLGSACGEKIHEALTEKDISARDAAFRFCLSSYLRCETSNPPGHESVGVGFLEAAFQKLRIPTLRFSSTDARVNPVRENLIATLTPSNSANGPLKSEPFAWGSATGLMPASQVLPSVLLLNHIDVIGAKPEQWAAPELPFSGAERTASGISDIWGRGALDMKGIAMLQLFAMASLKMGAVPIERAIHFAAVADEEEDGSGALHLVKGIRRGGDYEALLGIEVVLGEGGFSIRDALGAGSLIHLIGTEEKGGAWLQLEHKSASVMFASLDRLGMIKAARKNFDRSAKQWGCKLTSSALDVTKVNVSPSRLTAEISCNVTPKLTALKTAFETADSRTYDSKGTPVPVASIRVEALGNGARIGIETSSTQHGAASMSLSAVDVLVLGLQRISALKVESPKRPKLFDYYKTPATNRFLKTVGESHQLSRVPRLPNLQSVVGAWGPTEQWLLGKLGDAFGTEGLFRTSCSWNGFEVTAEQTRALLDCRLMDPKAAGITPGHKEGSQFADRIRDFIDDKTLSIEVLNEWNFTESPIQHAAVRAIAGESRTEWPKGSATPWLFPAGSDLRVFREPQSVGGELKPVPSYGFFPAPIPVSYLATVHGSNERFPVSEVTSAVNVYTRVLERLAK